MAKQVYFYIYLYLDKKKETWASGNEPFLELPFRSSWRKNGSCAAFLLIFAQGRTVESEEKFANSIIQRQIGCPKTGNPRWRSRSSQNSDLCTSSRCSKLQARWAKVMLPETLYFTLIKIIAPKYDTKRAVDSCGRHVFFCKMEPSHLFKGETAHVVKLLDYIIKYS